MRTNCADDGGSPVVSWRSVLGVELGEPLNSRAASIQMVQSVRHCGMRLIVSVSVELLLCEVLRGIESFSRVGA